jgi:peptidyl-tRNA hydrolase ICT1
MLKSLLRFFSTTIPKDRLIINYSYSLGSSSNVSLQIDSKVEIRFQINSSNWLTEDDKKRLKILYPHNLNKEGEFSISSQSNSKIEHNDILSNEQDALEKLQSIIDRVCDSGKSSEASTASKVYETDEQKKRRIEIKRTRGEIKSSRKPGNLDF